MKNKVTIIGAGLVGSTTAYSLIAAQIVEEVALVDINQDLVKAEVMDLQHSVPFWGSAKVKVGSYDDVKDSRVVVVTCGASQKSGENRLDLVQKNAAIIKEVVPKIFKANPNVILVMVTNPVDILTYLAIKMFPEKKKQIFGSGTLLDSARFRCLIGEKVNVNPKSIHAYIVGEHGDSEVPLWSTASVGNASLDDFYKINKADKNKIFEAAKNAAYAIIKGKQATYYAIAAGITQIVATVLFNKKTVLPLSHLVEGSYGIKDIALSLPVVLGGSGIEEVVELKISSEEKKQLKLSAKQLQQVAKKIM